MRRKDALDKMWKFDNSPEYERAMKRQSAKWKAESEAKEKALKKALAKARRKVTFTWLPIASCPFAALGDNYGADAQILVSDGENVDLVRVQKMFGTPIYYDEEPEYVYRDGLLHVQGGKLSPKNRFPAWWYKWELKSQTEQVMAYGDYVDARIGWVPTHWSPMPLPAK